MIKVRCNEIGNCPLADGQTHEVESISGHKCALRDEFGRCGLEEVTKGAGPTMPRLPLQAVVAGILVVVLIGVLGAGGWWAYGALSGPACDTKKINALLSLDPKASEVTKAGTACMHRGLKKGDMEALVMGVQLLRRGAAAGSAPAAVSLAGLYDPLKRAELEKHVKSLDFLPPTDPALAVRYYDLASASDASARDSAKALRVHFTLPEADGSQAANGKGLPLAMPGYDGFYQRVLVKPGAVLQASPDAGAQGQPAAVFDILYVFERRPGWLRVGHDLHDGPEGWVAADKTENWTVMLVAGYAPPGPRLPVLFFKDDLSIASLLAKPGAADEVKQLEASAQSSPDPRLAAVEDKSVDWGSHPYVMPILQTHRVTTDDGRSVYLAHIASVTGATSASGSGVAARPAAPQATPSYCTDTSQATMRHAVVFVIDTTISMQPYINEVKGLADGWAQALGQRGISDKVRFGLIAYRNNMDQEPQKSQLEYVTKVAAPLSPSTDINTFRSAVSGLSEAKVSTRSVDEDTVAGLKAAIDQDWSPYCGARIIVFVTDAGALRSDDPLANQKGVGLTTIAAEAREKHIAIFPVHLLTPEARRANDIERARAQYQGELGATGSNPASNYMTIPDGAPAGFRTYLGKLGSLLDGIHAISTNRPLEHTDVKQAKGEVSQMILNELFSVQQRFIGATAGATAPTFSDSWTSDRDLANPDVPALEIKLFLTRRQLSQLAEQTDRLTRSARSAQLETSRFFNLLRMASAATSQDPKRFGDDSTQIGDLLPSFLNLLPYKSDVLSLNAADWRGMGASKQDAFVRRLEEKYRFYQAIEADQSKWRKLGSADPNEAVALVPISELP
jgi:serine/threonine-protein kinase PpkA